MQFSERRSVVWHQFPATPHHIVAISSKIETSSIIIPRKPHNIILHFHNYYECDVTFMYSKHEHHTFPFAELAMDCKLDEDC